MELSKPLLYLPCGGAYTPAPPALPRLPPPPPPTRMGVLANFFFDWPLSDLSAEGLSLNWIDFLFRASLLTGFQESPIFVLYVGVGMRRSLMRLLILVQDLRALALSLFSSAINWAVVLPCRTSRSFRMYP